MGTSVLGGDKAFIFLRCSTAAFQRLSREAAPGQVGSIAAAPSDWRLSGDAIVQWKLPQRTTGPRVSALLSYKALWRSLAKRGVCSKPREAVAGPHQSSSPALHKGFILQPPRLAEEAIEERWGACADRVGWGENQRGALA